MPTAPKLVGALSFAALGYLLFISMVVVIGDDIVPPYLLAICVISGTIFGWRICGRSAKDVMSGVAHGFTAVACIVVSVAAIVAIMRMFKLAWRKRYDEPVAAAQDAIDMMISNFVKFGTPEIITLLVVGSFVGGALTGFAAQLSRRK